MATGKVKWFNGRKGYGFIETASDKQTGQEIFVHYSEIVQDGYKSLAEGQVVEFELYETSKGMQAKNVAPVA